MKKVERIISIILLVSLLVPWASIVYPVEVQAALTKQQECELKKENAELAPPPTFPKCSANGMPFNTKYWNDLAIVVYGEAAIVPSNQYKPNWQDLGGNVRTDTQGKHPYINGGEYRYYGWDQLGNLFTNPYFINDKKGSDPSERQWIWRPWSNALLSGIPNKPNDFSSPIFNAAFYTPDDIDTPEDINQVNTILKTNAVTVKKTTNSADENKYLFNYMYVQQRPTVWAPGSGRMYSLGAKSNKVWYQTFTLDEITSKPTILTPVVAKIDPDPVDQGSTVDDKYPNNSSVKLDKFPTDTFHLNFRMSGTIQDQNYMTGPDANYKKSIHYTREDLESWELKIEVQHQGKPNTVYKTFTSPDVILNGNQGYQDINIPVNKADYTSGGTLTIRLTATATYHSKQSPKPRPSATSTYRISFGTTPPPPEPEPQDLTQPEPLVCSPNIPTDAFDIVAFSASDSTDMSKVESRTVTIDGTAVSDAQFFSGSYIFGDNADGLRQITVKWTPKPGATYEGDPGCQETRYVRVHDTKPRSQFKMSGGTWKENRKMTIDNTSLDPNANDPFVIAAYPITSWSWSYQGLNGSSDTDRKMKTNADTYKEFLYKKKGQYRITLTATNTLGRTSDPYILDFTVLEDFAPAVILHPYNSQIGRGEQVSMTYDTVSTDGDIIKTHSIKVYYDASNNETYTQLVATLNAPISSSYTPPGNKIGKYKIVATVDEDFGQVTIPELITAADRRATTVETVFEVDNYIPYSDIYTDIPYNRPQVDVYFMLDKNLTQSKTNYVTSHAVTMNNQLRFKSMDPQVNIWDMHTYTFTTALSTSSFTGTSYPSSSTYYCSGGYCGTLSRTSVSNNGYYYDYGYYTTVTETKSASAGCSNTQTVSYNSKGVGSSSWSGSCPGSWSYSDGDGYSGTLSRGGTSPSSGCSTSGTPNTTCSTTFSTSYSGTVSRTRTVWVPNVQYVNQYTGYYSGTGSKDVRQAYINPFTRTTSDKYVVYISDTIINQLSDFNMVKAQSDAGIILVGNKSIKSQTVYEHFILNSGQSIESIIDSVVSYIASNNPPIATETVEVNQTFNLYTLEIDAENDSLIKRQTMYVHNENFYDNPQGRAAFASGSYATGTWSNQTLRTSFTLPGRYTIYRRVQDEPSSDPAFAPYSYYSNEAQVNINVHRKPIAQAALNWTYSTGCNCYLTTWVDQSYDLDHQFSNPNKGIIERKIRYRKNGGEWIYAIPNNLDYGTYNLEYVVRDMELAWSNPFTMNFTLAAAPPIQMNARARTESASFTMSSIPASEKLRIYNIWTRYPYTHSLSVALFQGGTQRTTAQTAAYYTGTKKGNDIDWNDIVYTIPNTTPDGSYMLRLTAAGQTGQSNYLEWPVTVNTPINLTPSVPNPLVVNQTQNLTATTTKYPSTTTVQLFRGTAYQTSTLSLTGTTSGSTRNWLRAYTVPNVPDGTYTARYISTTPSGKTETKDVTVQLTHNRPPSVEFDWTPKPAWEGDTAIFNNRTADPDGDQLTFSWKVASSTGSILFTSAIIHMQYRFSAPGEYTVTLTASDGKASSSAAVTVRALPLLLEPDVGHTPEWLAYHEDKGHETTTHPKQFFSGERFELSVVGSPAETERVIAWIDTTGSNGSPIFVETELSVQGHPDRYHGVLYDPIFSSLSEGLPEGRHQIRFRIDYANGVTKEQVIPIEIIGHVQETVNVHRRR